MEPETAEVHVDETDNDTDAAHLQSARVSTETSGAMPSADLANSAINVAKGASDVQNLTRPLLDHQGTTPSNGIKNETPGNTIDEGPENGTNNANPEHVTGKTAPEGPENESNSRKEAADAELGLLRSFVKFLWNKGISKLVKFFKWQQDGNNTSEVVTGETAAQSSGNATNSPNETASEKLDDDESYQEDLRLAVQTIRHAMRARISHEREIAAVQVSQHIASKFRAYQQGHEVKNGICIISDCQQFYDGAPNEQEQSNSMLNGQGNTLCSVKKNEIPDNVADGLSGKVKQLFEKFSFKVETEIENIGNNTFTNHDFVALYVLEFDDESRQHKILEDVRRYSNEVPKLVVIQLKSEQLKQHNNLNSKIDYPNSLVITTPKVEYITMFHKELRLHCNTFDLSTIELMVRNRFTGTDCRNTNVVNTLKQKVFLEMNNADSGDGQA